LYHNDKGQGFTLVPNTNLPPAFFSGAQWADFDKDGFPDVFVHGINITNTISSGLFRNLGGSGRFQKVSLPRILSAGGLGFAAWGDFNGDSWLDLVVTGGQAGLGGLGTAVGINNNGTSFTAINATNAGLPLVTLSDVLVGDFDNDNLPDVAITGVTVPVPVTNVAGVFTSNGGGTFTSAFTYNVSATGYNFELDLLCGDIDNDLRLDLMLIQDGTNATFFKNTGVVGTTPPPPTNVRASYVGSTLSITWNAPSGVTRAFTYNVGVSHGGAGIIPGATFALSALSLVDGTRQVAQLGNAYANTFLTLYNVTLTPPIIVGVQTVDAAYRGSTFAFVSSGNVLLPGWVLFVRLFFI